jgi:hypothetical protein
MRAQTTQARGLALPIRLSLLVVSSAASAQPTPASPALPRLAVQAGRFVEKDSREPFTPLGVNYFRTGKVKSGKVVHATFCPGFYDRPYIERMMGEVAGWGFNTVRTFQAYHVGEEGILASPEAREISPAYLANVVHFLRQAQRCRLRVIFSWDVWLPPSAWWAAAALPGEAACDLRTPWDEALGINNFRLGLESLRTRANAIVALIEALRREDAGLLSTVLSWELENEVFFASDRAPFASRRGAFHFAGRDYDLASDAETQALMDAIIVQWANLGAEAIHRADPDALVGTGVFAFNAVGRTGPGTLSTDQTKDNRIPARPLALLRSKLDYLDVHLYAWRSPAQSVAAHLDRDLASIEWEALQAAARQAGKPILCGESGVFANYLRSPPAWAIDHALGLACHREHQQALAAKGLAGTLYWHYGNPDTTANDESPALSLFPAYAQALREIW